MKVSCLAPFALLQLPAAFVIRAVARDIHEFAHAGMAHLWMPSGTFIANAGEVL